MVQDTPQPTNTYIGATQEGVDRSKADPESDMGELLYHVQAECTRTGGYIHINQVKLCLGVYAREALEDGRIAEAEKCDRVKANIYEHVREATREGWIEEDASRTA
jgi:hypothetical protein